MAEVNFTFESADDRALFYQILGRPDPGTPPTVADVDAYIDTADPKSERSVEVLFARAARFLWEIRQGTPSAPVIGPAVAHEASPLRADIPGQTATTPPQIFSPDWFRELPNDHPAVFFIPEGKTDKKKYVIFSSGSAGVFLVSEKKGMLVYTLLLNEPRRRHYLTDIVAERDADPERKISSQELIDYIEGANTYQLWRLAKGIRNVGLTTAGEKIDLKIEGDEVVMTLRKKVDDTPEVHRFHLYTGVDEPIAETPVATEINRNWFKSLKTKDLGVIYVGGVKCLLLEAQSGGKGGFFALLALGNQIDKRLIPEIYFISPDTRSTEGQELRDAILAALAERRLEIPFSKRKLFRLASTTNSVPVTANGSPISLPGQTPFIRGMTLVGEGRVEGKAKGEFVFEIFDLSRAAEMDGELPVRLNTGWLERLSSDAPGVFFAGDRKCIYFDVDDDHIALMTELPSLRAPSPFGERAGVRGSESRLGLTLLGPEDEEWIERIRNNVIPAASEGLGRESRLGSPPSIASRGGDDSDGTRLALFPHPDRPNLTRSWLFHPIENNRLTVGGQTLEIVPHDHGFVLRHAKTAAEAAPDTSPDQELLLRFPVPLEEAVASLPRGEEDRPIIPFTVAWFKSLPKDFPGRFTIDGKPYVFRESKPEGLMLLLTENRTGRLSFFVLETKGGPIPRRHLIKTIRETQNPGASRDMLNAIPHDPFAEVTQDGRRIRPPHYDQARGETICIDVPGMPYIPGIGPLGLTTVLYPLPRRRAFTTPAMEVRVQGDKLLYRDTRERLAPKQYTFHLSATSPHPSALASQTHPLFTPEWFEALPDSHPTVFWAVDEKGEEKKFVLLGEQKNPFEYGLVGYDAQGKFCMWPLTYNERFPNVKLVPLLVQKALGKTGRRILRDNRFWEHLQKENRFVIPAQGAMAETLFPVPGAAVVTLTRDVATLTVEPDGRVEERSVFSLSSANPFLKNRLPEPAMFSPDWFALQEIGDPGVVEIDGQKYVLFNFETSKGYDPGHALLTSKTDGSLLITFFSTKTLGSPSEAEKRSLLQSGNFLAKIIHALNGNGKITGLLLKDDEATLTREFFVETASDKADGANWKIRFFPFDAIKGATCDGTPIVPRGNRLVLIHKSGRQFKASLSPLRATPEGSPRPSAPAAVTGATTPATVSQPLFSKEWFNSLPDSHPAVVPVLTPNGKIKRAVYLRLDGADPVVLFGLYTVDESEGPVFTLYSHQSREHEILHQRILRALNAKPKVPLSLAAPGKDDGGDPEKEGWERVPLNGPIVVKNRYGEFTSSLEGGRIKHVSTGNTAFLSVPNTIPPFTEPKMFSADWFALQEVGDPGVMEIDEYKYVLYEFPDREAILLMTHDDQGQLFAGTIFKEDAAMAGTVITHFRKILGDSGRVSGFEWLDGVHPDVKAGEYYRTFGIGAVGHTVILFPFGRDHGADLTAATLRVRDDKLSFKLSGTQKRIELRRSNLRPKESIPASPAPQGPPAAAIFSEPWFNALPDSHPAVFWAVDEGGKRKKFLLLEPSNPQAKGIAYVLVGYNREKVFSYWYVMTPERGMAKTLTDGSLVLQMVQETLGRRIKVISSSHFANLLSQVSSATMPEPGRTIEHTEVVAGIRMRQSATVNEDGLKLSIGSPTGGMFDTFVVPEENPFRRHPIPTTQIFSPEWFALQEVGDPGVVEVGRFKYMLFSGKDERNSFLMTSDGTGRLYISQPFNEPTLGSQFVGFHQLLMSLFSGTGKMANKADPDLEQKSSITQTRYFKLKAPDSDQTIELAIDFAPFDPTGTDFGGVFKGGVLHRSVIRADGHRLKVEYPQDPLNKPTYLSLYPRGVKNLRVEEDPVESITTPSPILRLFGSTGEDVEVVDEKKAMANRINAAVAEFRAIKRPVVVREIALEIARGQRMKASFVAAQKGENSPVTLSLRINSSATDYRHWRTAGFSKDDTIEIKWGPDGDTITYVLKNAAKNTFILTPAPADPKKFPNQPTDVPKGDLRLSYIEGRGTVLEFVNGGRNEMYEWLEGAVNGPVMAFSVEGGADAILKQAEDYRASLAQKRNPSWQSPALVAKEGVLGLATVGAAVQAAVDGLRGYAGAYDDWAEIARDDELAAAKRREEEERLRKADEARRARGPQSSDYILTDPSGGDLVMMSVTKRIDPDGKLLAVTIDELAIHGHKIPADGITVRHGDGECTGEHFSTLSFPLVMKVQRDVEGGVEEFNVTVDERGALSIADRKVIRFEEIAERVIVEPVILSGHPEPVEGRLESMVRQAHHVRNKDPFSLSLHIAKHPRTGERFIIKAGAFLGSETRGRLGFMFYPDRGLDKEVTALNPDQPVDFSDGKATVTIHYHEIGNIMYDLSTDAEGKITATRHPLNTGQDWKIEFRGADKRPLILGLANNAPVVEFPLTTIAPIRGARRFLRESHFRLEGKALQGVLAWARILGKPIPFDPSHHDAVALVTQRIREGTGLVHLVSDESFQPYQKNPDGTDPIRTIALSSAEYALLRAHLDGLQVEGAIANQPTAAKQDQPKIVPLPNVVSSEHLFIAPGEVLLPTEETMEWLHKTFYGRGENNPSPFTHRQQIDQRLEFETSHGQVLSIPIRWIATRRYNNPFTIDTGEFATDDKGELIMENGRPKLVGNGRRIEVYQKGHPETRRMVDTDIRAIDMGGYWNIYGLIPTEDGPIKSFNLKIVKARLKIQNLGEASPRTVESPVLFALGNMLDDNGTEEREGEFREAHQQALRERAYTYFRGDKLARVQPLYFGKREFKLAEGRDIDLIYVSEEASGSEVARLHGARIIGAKRDLILKPVLELHQKGDVIRLRHRASRRHPDVVRLIEIRDDSQTPRRFDWYVRGYSILERKTRSPTVISEEQFLLLLERKGIPLPKRKVAAPGTGHVDDEVPEDGPTVRFEVEIPELPEQDQGLSLPRKVERLTNAAASRELLARFPIHDDSFIPVEATAFAQALVGSAEEVLTFVGIRSQAVIQVRMTRRHDASANYYAYHESDLPIAIQDAAIFIPDPDRKKEKVYWSIPARFHEKHKSGKYYDQVDLQIVGNNDRDKIDLTLHRVNHPMTFSGKALFGFRAQLEGTPAKRDDRDLAATLVTWTRILGLHKGQRPDMIWQPPADFRIGDPQLVELSGRYELGLEVVREKAKAYLFQGIEAVADSRFGSPIARFFYTDKEDPSGTIKTFWVYREGRLCYLKNPETGRQYYFALSNEGELWVWDRHPNIRNFTQPPESIGYPMVKIDGREYKVVRERREAGRKEIQSKAVRLLDHDVGAGWEGYEVTAVLGRSQEVADEAVLFAKGDDGFIRVRFIVKIDPEGKLHFEPGQLRPEDEPVKKTFLFGDQFRIEPAEDTHVGTDGRVSFGHLRVVFHREKMVVDRTRRKKGGRPDEMEGYQATLSPYGVLKFDSRFNLVGDWDDFGVTQAHAHETEGFIERKLFPSSGPSSPGDQIGFLTKRAGMTVDLDRFNESMFTGGEAPVEGARILAGLEQTTASERDVPLLLSALVMLGHATVDEKRKTVSYEEKDLVSLAAFAALRNPAVLRGDIKRGDILYEPKKKQPKPDPDRGSPATTPSSSSPPRENNGGGDPVSGLSGRRVEPEKSSRVSTSGFPPPGVTRGGNDRPAATTDRRMLLLLQTARILSQMGYPIIGEALVVRGPEILDRLPLGDLVKNLYGLAKQSGPDGEALRSAFNREKNGGRLLALALAMRVIAKKPDAMAKLAAYLKIPASALPSAAIPGAGIHGGLFVNPATSISLQPALLPVH